jgi:hypothetical protein
MNQTQLVHSIASATGESLRTIHGLGFSLVTESPDDLEPENLQLVIDGPFCRGPLPYPGLAGDGSLPMGECLSCDLFFPFEADEVYAAGTINSGLSVAVS